MPSAKATQKPSYFIQYVIIACLILGGWSSFSLAQLSDPNSSEFFSSSSQTNFEFSDAISFLPVGEAYRLSGHIEQTGDSTHLNLHWDIAEGYYLYQHQLKFELAGAAITAELPLGQRKYDEYYERELEVYYHSLDITLALPNKISNHLEQKHSVRVHSQGCADAGLCYPPQWQRLDLHHGEVSLAKSVAPPPATGITTTGADAEATGSYLWAIMGALLGGIILNLMPCVFPVLSLKALSLARNADNPQTQHLHGWAYTIGAVSTFVAIAAIMLSLRHAGQAVGWGFQLQSPVVVALLAYLFFAMGLTLSGFITLGGNIAGAGQSLTEGHSYRSSFFTGALATLVASPCTAPFMGGALGYAVTQSPLIALSVFAALGFGMALPFLLLTYFPSLSQKLPKPGAWMETLKQLLAFPLYFTALWLLWVVGRQTNSDSVIFVVAGATALAFAVWLWQHKPARLWQQSLAAAILALALWPISQLQYATPDEPRALTHDWQPFTQARLEQLLRDGQPTFVNLTADWCITCLANDKAALDTEEAQAAFKLSGIVKLKGDWTHYNPEITQLLARFGRNGVPLYLLYSGEPNSKPMILPQILRQQTILEAIQKVKPTT